MAVKYITKGKGQGRKVIPIQTPIAKRPKVLTSIEPDKFNLTDDYMLNIAKDKVELDYLTKLHTDRQLLNHILLMKRDISNFDSLSKAYYNLLTDMFDVDKFLKDNGISSYKRFMMSSKDKRALVLHIKGISDTDIDAIQKLYDLNYKFKGVDNQSYSIRFGLLHDSAIMPTMESRFKEHLPYLSTLFNYFNIHIYSTDISDSRAKELNDLSEVKYHEVYKDAKGYIKI